MLDIINSRLARRLANALTDLLQTTVEIMAEPTAPIKLGEFLSYQAAPACINIISLLPLNGIGLICLQSDLFFVLLNTLLGGGTNTKMQANLSDRDFFTPFEMEFSRNLVEIISREFEPCWTDVLSEFRPTYIQTEINPQQVTTGTASDVMMTSTFQIKLLEMEGKLDIAIPYMSLEPIKAELQEHPTEGTEADRNLWQKRLIEAVLSIPLRTHVELGHIPMVISQFIGLAPGHLVRLDRDPLSPLPLFLGGRFKGWISPMEVKGNLAFEFKDWRKENA